MSTDPAESPPDTTRLGRAIVERYRGPHPLQVREAARLGDVAASSMRFVRGWGRPTAIRRMLSGPGSRATDSATDLAVAPPRWWTGSDSAAELPTRGLRRAAGPVPSEGSRRPGGVPAGLVARAVPMKLPEEVAAVGRMTTPADARTRRMTARSPRSSGGAGGSGTGSSSASRAGPPADAPAEPARAAAATRAAGVPAHGLASHVLRRRAHVADSIASAQAARSARRPGTTQPQTPRAATPGEVATIGGAVPRVSAASGSAGREAQWQQSLPVAVGPQGEPTAATAAGGTIPGPGSVGARSPMQAGPITRVARALRPDAGHVLPAAGMIRRSTPAAGGVMPVRPGVAVGAYLARVRAMAEGLGPAASSDPGAVPRHAGTSSAGATSIGLPPPAVPAVVGAAAHLPMATAGSSSGALVRRSAGRAAATSPVPLPGAAAARATSGRAATTPPAGARGTGPREGVRLGAGALAAAASGPGTLAAGTRGLATLGTATLGTATLGTATLGTATLGTAALGTAGAAAPAVRAAPMTAATLGAPSHDRQSLRADSRGPVSDRAASRGTAPLRRATQTAATLPRAADAAAPPARATGSAAPLRRATRVAAGAAAPRESAALTPRPLASAMLPAATRGSAAPGRATPSTAHPPAASLTAGTSTAGIPTAVTAGVDRTVRRTATSGLRAGSPADWRGHEHGYEQGDSRTPGIPGVGHRRAGAVVRRRVTTGLGLEPATLRRTRTSDRPTMAIRQAGAARLGGVHGVPTAALATPRMTNADGPLLGTPRSAAPSPVAAVAAPAAPAATSVRPRVSGSAASPMNLAVLPPRVLVGSGRTGAPPPSATPPATVPPATPAAAGATIRRLANPLGTGGGDRPPSGLGARPAPGEGTTMRYTFMQPEPASAAAPAEPAWASELEQRLVDRVDEWFARELDERVIRIVEDKLRDETERRAWRGGAGVF